MSDDAKTTKLEHNKNRTFKEQTSVENLIKKIFEENNFDISRPDDFNKEVKFYFENHLEFAKKHMRKMPGGYAGIDAGIPWFSYWVLNIFNICSLNKYELSYDQKLKFVNYLKELRHEDGGFCGYAKGYPHIVSNYAAVMAIISLGIKEAYDIIDKEKMKKFLKRMKCTNKNISNCKYDKKGYFLIEQNDKNYCSNFKSNSPGSFQMHENGESDLRAAYCALTVAYILNIVDDELLEGVFDNIKLCQSFEGGLGPEPLCEAHGGYSFCGIATLVLFNKLDSIDMDRFMYWITNKQMSVEGGFQGRTNKLVDSCYSFWQSSVFNLLANYDKKYTYDTELLYNQLGLQAYVLLCCQNENGGLWDKPGKGPDLFHTNYASAGLALSQKCFLKDENEELKIALCFNETLDFCEVDPIFCVLKENVEKAKNYFWNYENDITQGN